MKSTEAFKNTIRAHLEKVAAADPAFAEKFRNGKKNIDDCCTYILNKVKASGCNGFADDEIYGMAMHYYDEENIDPGKPVSTGSVVVNHHIELTEEEKKQAREKANKEFLAEELRALRDKKQKEKEQEEKRVERERKKEEKKAEQRKAKIEKAQQTLF